MSDYNVQIKIRNGRLLRKIRAAELTLSAVAEKAGITLSTLYRYLALTLAPLTPKGERRPSVDKLAAFFKCSPFDLFPPDHLLKPLRRNTAELEMNLSDALRIANIQQAPRLPDHSMRQEEFAGSLNNLMQALTPREERVIRMRFGFDGAEHTLDYVGEKLGCGKERVRQIEAKAIRKLRSPTSLKLGEKHLLLAEMRDMLNDAAK